MNLERFAHLSVNRELVGVRPLHLAFARPLCLLERPTGAIHCFRNRKAFQRLLVLFKGFLLVLQKSFFCLSAWRSHIVPYRNCFCKPFLHFFRLFLRFVYIIQFFARFQGMFWPFFHHFCAKQPPHKKCSGCSLGFSSFLPASSPAGSARLLLPASAAQRSGQWAWDPAHYNKHPPG